MLEKIKKQVRRYSHLLTLNNAVLVTAVLIASGWVWGSMDALQRNYVYQQQVNQSQAEVDLLGLEADNLSAEQNYYKSDEYLELAAREKFNKAAPGEKLLILPKAVSPEKTMASASAPAVRSNFAQWMDFLFGQTSS